MGIYEYLKLTVSGRIPDRVKLLGLWAFMVARRRMIGVFLDPVLACNLRCKMCYMSDPEARKPMRGQRMTAGQLDHIATALFPYALKLQIGCATEPTLYPDLEGIVRRARVAGVPYISLTTNGKCIAHGKPDLGALVDAGLNELTLSLHGTTKEVYENLMPGAKYEELQQLTRIIADVKRVHPAFKVRVNYTINSANIHDLEEDKFWSLWQPGGLPDIIQLRPVQEMGQTEWNDFDLTPLKEHYHTTIGAIRRRCSETGITIIAPELTQLDEVATDQTFTQALFKEITYCYVSPEAVYMPDFEDDDTFATYHRRKKTARRIFRAVFARKHATSRRDSSKHLNYRVD